MADVRRFRPRAERDAKRKNGTAIQLFLAFLSDADVDTDTKAKLEQHARRKVAALDRDAEGWRFMQVNWEREAEIVAALRLHTTAPHEAETVLRAVRGALSPTSQRMTKTQAEIAQELGLRKQHASRAFRALLAAGAIMVPQRERGSLTYEVDANFATKLGPDERGIEAARQASLRDRPMRESARGVGSTMQLVEVVRLSSRRHP